MDPNLAFVIPIRMSTPIFNHMCIPVVLEGPKYRLVHRLQFMCCVAWTAEKNNIISCGSIHNAWMKMTTCTIKY